MLNYTYSNNQQNDDPHFFPSYLLLVPSTSLYAMNDEWSLKIKVSGLGLQSAFVLVQNYFYYFTFFDYEDIFFVYFLLLNSQHFSCFTRRMSFSMLHAENCVVFCVEFIHKK